MRYVKFIKGLQVDERPVLGPDEIRYHVMEPMPVPLFNGDDQEEYLLPEGTVETMVVPVHELRGCDKEDPRYPPELYIAYSKDVQMLLQMPFDVMKRQLDEQSTQIMTLYDERAAIRRATWWRRLVYVFDGDLLSLAGNL